MVILNTIVAWVLWHQADGLLSHSTRIGKSLGWACVALSALNAAHVAVWVSERL